MMRRYDFYEPYSPPFSPPERKLHDPYLYTLVCQTALCLLLLLCGRAFQSAQILTLKQQVCPIRKFLLLQAL